MAVSAIGHIINKLQIDKAGDKVLLYDNHQVNLIATRKRLKKRSKNIYAVPFLVQLVVSNIIQL